MQNNTSVEFRDSGSADGNAERYGMAPHRCRHVPIHHVAATAILVAGVVTTVVPLHTDP